MKVACSLLFAGLVGVFGGCAGFQSRSEVPVTEAQIAGLREGIGRAQLLQTLGPPADEATYTNLNESVLSWRLVEPGNQRWLFNAHLDPSGRVKYYSRVPDPAANGGNTSPS